MLPVAEATPGMMPSRLLNRMKKNTVQRYGQEPVGAVPADRRPGHLVADEEDHRLEHVHEPAAADGFRAMCRATGTRISSIKRRGDQLHHHEPRDLERRRSPQLDRQLVGLRPPRDLDRGVIDDVAQGVVGISGHGCPGWGVASGRGGLVPRRAGPAPPGRVEACQSGRLIEAVVPALAGGASPGATRVAGEIPGHPHAVEHPDEEAQRGADQRGGRDRPQPANPGQSRPPAGSANSSPMVVTREAISRPTPSGDRGSGCSTTHDSSSPAAPRTTPAGTIAPARLRTNLDPVAQKTPRQGDVPVEKLYCIESPLSTTRHPLREIFHKVCPV